MRRMKSYPLRAAFALLAAVLLVILSPARGSTSRPNIIVVMPDDAGYGDYACLGNPIMRTPSVDSFKKESLLFTQFHASPTCSPCRAALMSGRHEFRNGVTHTIGGRERMSLKTFALPQMLKSVGYTTGIFGKWHLGDEEAYRPESRGFDEVYIHGSGGIGQGGDAPNNTNIDPALWHNGKFEKTKGYCTDLFFARAIDWMNARREEEKPFFAYISLNAPHAPHDLPEEYYRQYLGKPRVREEVAKFYGMIENIDTNFAALLKKLRDWGIENDTLVIYIGTDNGGTAGRNIFNAGMKGGKATPYQGGTRVPCFFRWPGGGIPAGAECDALTSVIDMFATLAEITGAKLPDEVKPQVEGRSLLPLLKNPKAAWADRTLVHHVGRWERGKVEEAKYTKCSIQNSQYTLVNNTKLYDLKNDPGETTNVIADHPEVATRLRAAYDRWWTDVRPLLVNENAARPEHNPFKTLYWKQFGRGPAKEPPKGTEPNTDSDDDSRTRSRKLREERRKRREGTPHAPEDPNPDGRSSFGLSPLTHRPSPNMRMCFRILPALLHAAVIAPEPCRAADKGAALAARPFFALCMDTHDSKKRDLAQQAKLLKELGYDGAGHLWLKKVPERLKTLDAHGLKLFQIYLRVNIGGKARPYDAALKEVLPLLKGRDTTLALLITGGRPSDEAGDARAVKILREIADLATASGVKIVLYPHARNWLERVEDAVRVVKKVDRTHVGVMFNLCHWLKVDEEKNLLPVLKLAMPHLMAVSIHGADTAAEIRGGKGNWIQPLGNGSFDVYGLLKTLDDLGYRGPVGLQCYGLPGDAREHLTRSIAAWRKLCGRLSAAKSRQPAGLRRKDERVPLAHPPGEGGRDRRGPRELVRPGGRSQSTVDAAV